MPARRILAMESRPFGTQRLSHREAARRGLRCPAGTGDGTDLRSVMLHLINEAARHAGQADATRELLDGLTGE
ncbi:MAG: DUF664 domain-containing protein [Candidatus Dormiibacterota bacterium]